VRGQMCDDAWEAHLLESTMRHVVGRLVADVDAEPQRAADDGERREGDLQVLFDAHAILKEDHGW
jgi:hypothetical protein